MRRVLFTALSLATALALRPSVTGQSVNRAPPAVSPQDEKDRITPAWEIPAFLVLLNQYDRRVVGDDDFRSTWRTTSDHFRHQHWGFDNDPFNVNQFAHPYLGATMYGFARSAGVGPGESLLYTNAGSFLWEMAGEKTRPSINDLFTTGQAGGLLGESLFRMASLILERSERRRPKLRRELVAGLLCPPLAFNRYAFGDRFKTIFPSHGPADFWRVQLGASLDAKVSDNSPLTTVKRQEATLDFEFAYGLPGKPGYTYERPFDYFQFEFAALSGTNTHNWLENILVRGLLWGRDYELGDNYAGIWGVYGSYDYISPQTFRVSNTAVSVGTTSQWWIRPALALQGTVTSGIGFGAAGTQFVSGERDYHFGATPQVLVALRLILGRRAMLELASREYYVTGTGSDQKHGSETIFRETIGATVRVYHRHALGVQFVGSRRNAHYPGIPDRRQTVGTFRIVYTLLGDTSFGAVGSHSR